MFASSAEAKLQIHRGVSLVVVAMGNRPVLAVRQAAPHEYSEEGAVGRRSLSVKLLALVAVTALTLAMLVFPPKALGFTDVGSSTAYQEATAEMHDRGIVSGFDDGTFRPLDTASRMQFAKMIVRALGMQPLGEVPCPLVDVPGHLDAKDALYTPPFGTVKFSTREHYENARMAAYYGLLDGVGSFGQTRARPGHRHDSRSGQGPEAESSDRNGWTSSSLDEPRWRR